MDASEVVEDARAYLQALHCFFGGGGVRSQADDDDRFVGARHVGQGLGLAGTRSAWCVLDLAILEIPVFHETMAWIMSCIVGDRIEYMRVDLWGEGEGEGEDFHSSDDQITARYHII